MTAPLAPLRSDIVDYIRNQCEEEKVDPPIPRNHGDIPVSYEVITKDWLNATLVKWVPDNVVVKDFQLGPKDNGSANRRRIDIQWEGPGADQAPSSVFCKAAHSLQNRTVLASGGTYSEVLFYNDIRPKLEIEAPRAYFAGYNPDSWAAMIMLHDMGDSTTFCDYKTVLTKTQAVEQVQTLARLHGRFYESKDPNFGRLLSYKDRIRNLERIGIESACKNGFTAAKEVIPTRLFQREEEIWPCTMKSVDRNAALPQTVVHGDVHLGNWYITSESHIGLTDWQTMARGHWSRDLTYVLGTGISTENRRLWEDELVETYLEEFEATGGPKVPVAEAWTELRRQSLGALAYWTLTLTPSSAMPDMQTVDTTMCFIGRITALMDDHQVLDAFDF